MEQRRPADPRLLWGFWVLAAAGILLFIVLLRADLRETRPLDAALYTEAAPAGFGYGCEATPGEGVLTFRGWAAVEGRSWKRWTAAWFCTAPAKTDTTGCPPPWTPARMRRPPRVTRTPAFTPLPSLTSSRRGSWNSVLPTAAMATTP